MTSRIRVCRLGVHGEVSFPTIDDDAQGLYDALGGWAERIQLPEDMAEGGLIGLVDEEGLLKQLPRNSRSAQLGQRLVGPVLIARSDPPELVSLTEQDCFALRKWFG